MLDGMTDLNAVMAGTTLLGSALQTAKGALLMIAGFSLLIFVHELGHFLMAKLANVRVEKFAIGFGRELVGFTRGETRYSFNALPLGGYVRMLGQEDFAVDKTGEWQLKGDLRSFSSQPVGRRMLIVSAGVVMNLLFAAVLFMVVYMIGRDVPVNIIGAPLPNTPAERGGLQFGDRILDINGRPIRDYEDFRMAIVLAEPHQPMHIRVEREGKEQTCTVLPEVDPDRNLLQIGVPPLLTRVIVDVRPEPGPPREDALQPGDEVLEVDGRPVRDFFDITAALQAARGRRVAMLVERADPKDPSKKVRVTCTRQAPVQFAGTGEGRTEVGHLLGFVPRLRVVGVVPGSAADLNGIREGDVIAEWAAIVGPTWPEILASIQENPDVDLDVTLIRNGERVRTRVRPTRTDFWGRGKPQVGFDLSGQEQDAVVVADIVTEVDGRPTPAAALKGPRMPRGSVITKVDGNPVATWNELTDSFLTRAGTTVPLTWRYGQEPERTAMFTIPADITTLAGMPPLGRLIDIAGQSEIDLPRPDGKVAPYSVTHWRGAFEILKKHRQEHPDKPVTVRYRDMLDRAGAVVAKDVTIPAEALDPWTMRILFSDPMMPQFQTMRVQTWNPIAALWIGIRKTVSNVTANYVTMQRMIFTRSMGVEHISGPVGIINLGIESAKQGVGDLIYLLGILSVGLAVINFLPLPIVDGGLMVFLIIEKIKGSPVSLKIQMVTQVVGLALLAVAFLLVTFNDITKL